MTRPLAVILALLLFGACQAKPTEDKQDKAPTKAEAVQIPDASAPPETAPTEVPLTAPTADTPVAAPAADVATARPAALGTFEVANLLPDSTALFIATPNLQALADTVGFADLPVAHPELFAEFVENSGQFFEANLLSASDLDTLGVDTTLPVGYVILGSTPPAMGFFAGVKDPKAVIEAITKASAKLGVAVKDTPIGASHLLDAGDPNLVMLVTAHTALVLVGHDRNDDLVSKARAWLENADTPRLAQDARFVDATQSLNAQSVLFGWADMPKLRFVFERSASDAFSEGELRRAREEGDAEAIARWESAVQFEKDRASEDKLLLDALFVGASDLFAHVDAHGNVLDAAAVLHLSDSSSLMKMLRTEAFSPRVIAGTRTTPALLAALSVDLPGVSQTLIGSGDDGASFVKGLEEQARFMSDVQTGLETVFSGEVGFAVERGKDLAHPLWAVVLGVKDPTKATALLDGIATQPMLRLQTKKEGSVYTTPIPGDSLTFGVYGDALVVSNDPSFGLALVAGDTPSFSASLQEAERAGLLSPRALTLRLDGALLAPVLVRLLRDDLNQSVEPNDPEASEALRELRREKSEMQNKANERGLELVTALLALVGSGELTAERSGDGVRVSAQLATTSPSVAEAIKALAKLLVNEMAAEEAFWDRWNTLNAKEYELSDERPY